MNHQYKQNEFLFLKLTKPPEIFRFVLGTILGKEPLPRLNIITDGVLFANGASCAVTIRSCEEVLTDESLDMTCVAWHLLVSNFMVWPINPVLGVTTHIAKYNFVLIDRGHEVRAIQSTSLIHIPKSVENNWVLASIFQDLPFDLAGSGTESLVLGGHVTGVARQVLLIIIGWRCEFRHILNYQIK